MKWIHVSAHTYGQIAAAAVNPFRSEGRVQPDGSYMVPIADDTFEHIDERRFPGESDDDVVTRLIAIAQNRAN